MVPWSGSPVFLGVIPLPSEGIPSERVTLESVPLKSIPLESVPLECVPSEGVPSGEVRFKGFPFGKYPSARIHLGVFVPARLYTGMEKVIEFHKLS